MAAVALAAVALPTMSTSAQAASCARGAVTPGAEQSMLNQVNAHRSKAGVAPLRTSSRLTSAGRQSARKMARGARFAHDGFWWARGRTGAQNIAMAPAANGDVNAMMRSAPHRKNILNKRLRHAGVGAARDCRGQIFFTLNLTG